MIIVFYTHTGSEPSYSPTPPTNPVSNPPSDGTRSPVFDLASPSPNPAEAETDDSDADSSDTDLAAVLTQLIRRWISFFKL